MRHTYISSILLGLTLSLSLNAQAQVLQTNLYKVFSGFTMRVGVQAPATEAVGDIIYVHGFADRLDNHQELFNEWNQAGLRVIAFDLPSHGENKGILNNIDSFNFGALNELIRFAEDVTREDKKRPLFLSGWSTGGLIVTRYIEQFNQVNGRDIKGAVLFAPGIQVHPLVGSFGIVTKNTLTHNSKAQLAGAISPKSPFFHPIFASLLLKNAFQAKHSLVLEGIKTLVFTAGVESDKYVKTVEVMSWIKRNQSKDSGNEMRGMHCEDAYHGLDFESDEFGGKQVRKTSANFFYNQTHESNKIFLAAPGPCQLY